MRYTAMMWMRRANMAALGGGADIMPDEIEIIFWSDSGPHCPNCSDDLVESEDTDPMSDLPYEKENNV